jgi:hypothetical protein
LVCQRSWQSYRVLLSHLTYVHVGKARLAANGLSPLQEACVTAFGKD